MQRHITSLPIPNSYKVKLMKNGVESVNELKNVKPTELVKDFGFTRNELNDLHDTLNMYNSTKPISVFDMLRSEEQESVSSIPTFSHNFDSILRGGVPLGKITEVCGAAGVGKTQLCMQMCASVQIPQSLNGLEGQAVYIDTEGSFVTSRVVEITNAMIKILAQNFPNKDLKTEILRNFNQEKVLANIFLFRCIDHVQLMSTVNGLKDFLEKHPKVKLIVIDSLAYPFRFVDFKDTNSVAMKTNILNNFMTNAYNLLNKQNISILITNQMTTRIVRDVSTNSSCSSLVPALGESWAHSANLRIVLAWKNNLRTATVSKSSYLPDQTIIYRISEIGFTDFETGDESRLPSDESTSNQTKRRRFEEEY